MQFQVPQFIEIEDKIFGPLTLRQFIFLAGGVGASVALWFYLPYKILSILFIIPLLAFSLALTFYKINNRPFIDAVASAFYFYIGGKLYIWKKEEKKPEARVQDQTQKAKSLLGVPKISDSKLKDLTWSLDIKESISPSTRDDFSDRA